MSRLTLVLLSVLTLAAAPLAAQGPKVPFAGVSFGIDTTAADVGDIVRLVRAYLTGPGVISDSAAEAAGLWHAGSPADGPTGDMTRYFAYQGAPARVVGIVSASPGDSVYAVRVLYAWADSAGHVNPLALQRLYAVRAPGTPYGWQLSNALPRVTADWQRLSVGPIVFRYAPGLHPDSARARRAALFVDSVATLLALPKPARIDYLVTHAPDEYFRAIGLDFFPWASGRGSSIGGQGGPGLVLAGDPSAGEAYFHELTHAVLGTSCCNNGVMSEGLATWLGGSRERSPRDMYRLLLAYQRAYPKVTLRQLLDQDAPGGDAAVSDAGYATDALIVDAIYRRAGIAGVRVFMGIPRGTDAMLAALRGRFPAAARDIDAWWRRTAEGFAGSGR